MYIYVCNCIHKNIILSGTIVICSMAKSQSKRVTPKAKPDDPPAPRPNSSWKPPARYVNDDDSSRDEPSIGSTLAAFTATMLEQQRQFLDTLSRKLSEQPTASCSAAAKISDEPDRSWCPRGHETCLDFVSHNSTSIRYKYRYWAAPRTGAIIGFARWGPSSSKIKGKNLETCICGNVRYTLPQ